MPLLRANTARQEMYRKLVETRRRMLLLGLDVSSSARRHLPWMQQAMLARLRYAEQFEAVEVSTHLFHRQVMPFPSEQLCALRRPETTVLPTLADLRQRSGVGSAVMDALYWLLAIASACGHGRRDILLFTDGQDTCSQRHPAEIRRRIESVGDEIRISLIAPQVRHARDSLSRFVERLQISPARWSLSHVDNEVWMPRPWHEREELGDSPRHLSIQCGGINEKSSPAIDP